MSLEEISRKRKNELLALRSKLSKSDDSENKPLDLPKPKFRSYQPNSEELKQQVVPAAKPIDIADRVANDIAERQIGMLDTVDLSDLAPRKPDWDLKRALASKLKKLDRRTERAIAEIVRERLQQEAKEMHLADEGMDQSSEDS